VKYEQRLKLLKTEFEGKFKKNEQTWRQRMDCYKQIVVKEQAKVHELEDIISEMRVKMELMDKKAKEMQSIIKK
jgi:hypothetical protein